jgi:hypothetical protein
MSIANRIEKLEAEAPAIIFDLTVLTDEELKALSSCYDEQGSFIESHFTPDVDAALERARR